MRKRGRVRAGVGVVGSALAGLGLVKLLAYDRANRAPDPARCLSRCRARSRAWTMAWVCLVRTANR
jgi:hypothetical protein